MNMNCGKVRMMNENSSCCRLLQEGLDLHKERERERERERYIKQLVYSSLISNVELQSCTSYSEQMNFSMHMFELCLYHLNYVYYYILSKEDEKVDYCYYY